MAKAISGSRPYLPVAIEHPALLTLLAAVLALLHMLLVHLLHLKQFRAPLTPVSLRDDDRLVAFQLLLQLQVAVSLEMSSQLGLVVEDGQTLLALESSHLRGWNKNSPA